MAAAAQIEPLRVEQASLRFAPELELLLACLQPAAERNASLIAVLALPLDWDQVLRLANKHRLLPALHSALKGREDVPGSIGSAIRARFENHQLRVLRFTAELSRIARQFERSNIRFLAHKGAALAQLLYGDPSMRQFGDLDLFVQAADVPRAQSALQELGYAPKIQLSPRQEKEYLHSGYERVFGLARERNLVEVQWQVVPRFYAIDFDTDALFARSVELEIDGLRLRALGNDDQLLVLCVHAAKHEWAQLGMVRDIAALAGLDLDWNWIDAEARRMGIERIVAVSLRLAEAFCALDLSALPLIPKVMSGTANDATVIAHRIAAGVEGNTESFHYFRAFIYLRERWQDRLRMAWRLGTTPSVGEWQTVRLPDSVFSLYRGVRMFRLMNRFCFPALRSAVSLIE